jgi:hypothetical protein
MKNSNYVNGIVPNFDAENFKNKVVRDWGKIREGQDKINTDKFQGAVKLVKKIKNEYR